MVTNKGLLLELLTITATLFVFNIDTVDADGNWLPWSVNNSDGQQYEAVSLHKLESFWVDAVDVISDLDSYDKLWIKPHSCVWSECAVDDADDNYMGDNRDGDEQWYQYRTQDFCANAAYSLYGQKKEDEFFPSFSGCSRRHFINSFFTYGGADNLLKSIGESPVVYSYQDTDDGNDDNGNDEDGDGSSANTACVEIEYDGGDDYISNNDNDNDGGENDDNSNSGSNDNDEYSGTLGCGADGGYVIAAFQSSSCDGNYFAGIADDFEEYNNQHNAIGCHKIYEKDDEVSIENVMMLLNNSWSCDLRLYPNGCPDPYGEKEKYDFALRTVAHGGNPLRAYQNMMMKRPIHVISWTLLAVTAMVIVLTYLVKNESRARESKGGNNVIGYLRCLKEDIVIGWNKCIAWTALKCNTFVIWSTKKSGESNKDKKSSTKKESSNKGDEDDIATDDSDNSYVHVNDDENKIGNDDGVALKRNVTASAATTSATSGSADNNDPELLYDKDMARSGTWA